MSMETDSLLLELVRAIVAGDRDTVSEGIAARPELVKAAFQAGATRQNAAQYFLTSIGRYIIEGDTALHFAAAAYSADMVRVLIDSGADVSARNRHGATPLHAASAGQPASVWWNSDAQAATIECLLNAGANANATDKRGVAPLHIAVRTRCASAARALLDCGAEPGKPNGNGSSTMLLATQNTGRGGSGSIEAKKQQLEIIRMLQEREAVLQ